MRWHPKTDLLRIKIKSNNHTKKQLTKRNVISATAQIFDPSGLVLPVIVTGKILQQEIWRSGIGWDKQLPDFLLQKWQEYNESIAELDQIKIPRWLHTSSDDIVELHVFTDASEQAMGANAYFRVTNSEGNVVVNMITARSKVAPVKKVTIPRLELTAALIGAQLAQFIRQTFRLPDMNVYFWTDSTIVIHWLKKDPSLCKPYVANRVIAIREKGENGIWQHIEGLHNPADLLTRGMSAKKLANASIWWQGPAWLVNQPNSWPIPKVTSLSPEMQAAMAIEEKQIKTEALTIACKSKSGNFIGVVINRSAKGLWVTGASGQDEPLTSRRSELSSLIRTTAYVFRFISTVRASLAKRRNSNENITYSAIPDCDHTTIPPITNVEREAALLYWIANAQETFYSRELRIRRLGKDLPSNSTIVKLRPYLDDKGLMRVGGRLANAKIPDKAKNQLILPPQAAISHLLIRNAHFVTVHGGPQLMMAHLRCKF